MLFPSKTLSERVAKTLDEIGDPSIDPGEASHRLLAVDPQYAPAIRVLGNLALHAGNREEAERLLWQALELQPFGGLMYASLSSFYRDDSAYGDTGEYIGMLGLWAVALGPAVADEVAELFEHAPTPEVDYTDSATYRVLAEFAEEKLVQPAIPAELAERLRPYTLLNTLARGAVDALPREQWEEIRAAVDICVPIWRAALRAWARFDHETSSEALVFIVALLGEFAGPDYLEDLWEIADLRGDDLFLYTNWALCRMAQRFPEETLASLRAAIPRAKIGLRCSMAEHLGLMNGESVDSALLELVKDFQQFKGEHDAAYLLVATADALSQTGHPERSAELFAKYERQLSKEGRAWLRETLDDPAGFVPKIVEEELAEFDIEDVCLSRVLMHEDCEDFDGDEEDFEDDQDFDDEEDLDEPPVHLPKPGRNDPCWCGSGKKYKKCHLEADEEAARNPVEAPVLDEDPVRTEAMGGLLATAERLHKRRDQIEAARQYFGDDVDEAEVEEGSEGFFMWYLLNFRPETTGRTAVEEHLRKNESRLTPEVRAMLEAWRDSRYGLFEVGEKREDGLELKDLLAGDMVLVQDAEDVEGLESGYMILARLENYRDTETFSETPLNVISSDLYGLRKFIDGEVKTTGLTPAEVVQANIHQLHRLLGEL